MGFDNRQFTYGNDPGNSPVDSVRFLIGDTMHEGFFLDDREIAWALQLEPDHHLAAALLADHLSGVFAGSTDYKVGPVSVSCSKLSDAYKKKADSLRGNACKYVSPSFPSTEIVGACAEYSSEPEFFVGMTDGDDSIQVNELRNLYGDKRSG